MLGEQWHFRIGDPTVVAWVIVVAYAIAAALAGRSFVGARSAERLIRPVDVPESVRQRSMKHLWLVITTILLLLGINKQLDLQTLVIQTIRNRAYAHGWYDNRRKYQIDFIIAVMAAGLLGSIAIAVWIRHVLRRVWLAVTGIALLVVFVVVRAASLHQVDKVLSLGGSVRVNWILELSGIGLVAIGAVVFQRAERRQLTSTLAATRERVDSFVSSGSDMFGPLSEPSPPPAGMV